VAIEDLELVLEDALHETGKVREVIRPSVERLLRGVRRRPLPDGVANQDPAARM